MIALTLALILQGPTLDVCRRVTTAEVATVLGAAPAKAGTATIRGACTWSVPGVTLTVSAVAVHDPGAAAAMVGASKGTARKGDVVKDEAGGAMSMVAANGRTIQFLSASGRLLWPYVVEAADTALKPETTLAALRKLGSKAR